MFLFKVLLLFFFAFPVCSSVVADTAQGQVGSMAEMRFASGPEQTIMIELFTSQGCSSCPPSEEYVNSYINHPDLWKKYVPVVFHVDYWDYIGWKDRFAKPEHGRRHRYYADLGHVRQVYTPAMLVNGESWRRSIFSRNPDVKSKDVGVLDVAIRNNHVSARFEPAGLTLSNLDFNLAILGVGLSSKILSGEREGSNTQHEFVVLEHKTVRGNRNEWKMELPDINKLSKGTDDKARRYAIAAWVSLPGEPAPIQATGGLISRDRLR